ncbi:T9SS-dependent choice-of-anchor J family protein [Ichthyenterobacterium magnum]|nr:choice-of-anchor J domain-containing protein [Ichthyenterobacterium magnum]
MKKITYLFITFLMVSMTSNAQLTEGFESGIPVDWATFRGANNLGTSFDWTASTANPYAGSNSAFVRYENVSGGLAEDWMVTSQVDLTSLNNAQLRFFTRQGGTTDYGSTFQIMISTGTSQTTMGDFVSLGSITETELNVVGNVYEEKIIDLSAYDGDMIYIAFVMTNDNGDSWYIDDVSVDNGPQCDAVTNVSITNLLDTSVDFGWDAPLTGIPATYDWEVVPDGNAPGVGTVDSGVENHPDTSATATGLTANTAYDIYISSNCGVNGLETFGPLSFTTLLGPPPANDLPTGALTATQETSIPNVAAATAVGSSIAFAIQSGDLYDCFVGGIVPENITADDVWFKYTALTADVTLTVTSQFDAALSLYSSPDDTGNSITRTHCVDANTFTPQNEEIMILSGLTIGETYFFRVYQPNGSIPADPTFTYKLWSSTTLGVENVQENDLFTYYPNPVKDYLNVKGEHNILNVSIFNMLGQEVARVQPNKVEDRINMSNLQAGTYIVKVSTNNTTKTLRILKQ